MSRLTHAFVPTLTAITACRAAGGGAVETHRQPALNRENVRPTVAVEVLPTRTVAAATAALLDLVGETQPVALWGEGQIRIFVDGRPEWWPLRAPGFRHWWMARYRERYAALPPAASVEDALALLEAETFADTPGGYPAPLDPERAQLLVDAVECVFNLEGGWQGGAEELRAALHVATLPERHQQLPWLTSVAKLAHALLEVESLLAAQEIGLKLTFPGVGPWQVELFLKPAPDTAPENPELTSLAA